MVQTNIFDQINTLFFPTKKNASYVTSDKRKIHLGRKLTERGERGTKDCGDVASKTTAL